jgi:hypothetical protein
VVAAPVELEKLPVPEEEVVPVEPVAAPVVVPELVVAPELVVGGDDATAEPLEVEAAFEAALAAVALVRAAACWALLMIALARRLALAVMEVTIECSVARAARTIWVA